MYEKFFQTDGLFSSIRFETNDVNITSSEAATRKIPEMLSNFKKINRVVLLVVLAVLEMPIHQY